MYKLIYKVIFILFLILYTGCSSVSEKSYDSEQHQNLISECERLVGVSPDSAVQKIDNIINSGVEPDMFYRLLLIKAKAKLFLAENDSVVILLDSIERNGVSFDPDDKLRLRAGLYNMRGNLYGRNSVMDSAVIYFSKAFSCLQKHGSTRSMMDVSLNLADAYVRSGKFDVGAYWYRKSLSIADTLMIPKNERFPAYYGLAQVYMELRDYNQCDYFYDLAGSYYDSMLPYEKHIYLNNRGNSYYYREDYPTALEYFRRTWQLVNSRPEMEFERNLTMVNLGEVFMLMNETDSASYYLNRCYPFFRKINHISALYYIETQLIELALKQGKVDLAGDIIRKAQKPDFIEPNMYHIRNRYLQHYFEEKGDFKNAYYYQKKNKLIDDSIRNERIKMRTAEISLRYKQDSILMKKEFSIIEKENEVQRLNQWVYLLVLGILLIIAMSYVIYVYYKRANDRKIWNMRTAISSLKLENVRNRISPHFIFNVLNREVVKHVDINEKTNLVNLSKLIRRNLELTDKNSITLCDELDFVNTYISIQKQTMGDEFNYSIDIPSGFRCDTLYVPSMLVQIPVENAMKHALKMKKGMKCLWIRIKEVDRRVEISITDNDGGFKVMSENHGTGTGLKVITQSIQLFNRYNREQIKMRISNVNLENSEKGCEVWYSVPYEYSYNIGK